MPHVKPKSFLDLRFLLSFPSPPKKNKTKREDPGSITPAKACWSITSITGAPADSQSCKVNRTSKPTPSLEGHVTFTSWPLLQVRGLAIGVIWDDVRKSLTTL